MRKLSPEDTQRALRTILEKLYHIERDVMGLRDGKVVRLDPPIAPCWLYGTNYKGPTAVVLPFKQREPINLCPVTTPGYEAE